MKKFQLCPSKFFFKLCIILILVFPAVVSGDCDCDPEKSVDGSKAERQKYKVGAIAAILTAGAVGVCLPVLGRNIPALRPESDIFFMIKAFAAGVILCTGFIHILPDAFDDLTSPCLQSSVWSNFPFTGFIAMMSAIGTLMIDSFATGYYQRMHFEKHRITTDQEQGARDEHAGHVHVHTHATHGHSHGSAIPSEDGSGSELLRHRVISQVLEIGIVVHSVIIGISLGASTSLKTIRPLIGALSFHQFFEGMGLGGCITQAKFKTTSVAIMATFFSLTTPVGIAVGIGISNVYSESSQPALIVQGVFNAAAAGILIYMSLVDLLAADFMNPKLQSNMRLQFGANVSLLLGAGCMAVLAKWA
ncbi:hypothetical protein SLEP1_g18625 [Rubroshorea leprosula]|uniref:Uncharacterized protein n=1 Tax=Rubroshorea leprosula TaxID=152421 RepID=A0AAV5J774_9ROSI|nr:hypothetical protein SLEP1_g18625 [Rubroshorea leprosula]